jgi:uncharacterized protein
MSLSRVLAILVQAQQVQLEDVAAVSRDPKDDIFLATAVEANAQYIVSEDNDLLVLDPYEGIRILNALDFLHMLQERWSQTNKADE